MFGWTKGNVSWRGRGTTVLFSYKSHAHTPTPISKRKKILFYIFHEMAEKTLKLANMHFFMFCIFISSFFFLFSFFLLIYVMFSFLSFFFTKNALYFVSIPNHVGLHCIHQVACLFLHAIRAAKTGNTSLMGCISFFFFSLALRYRWPISILIFLFCFHLAGRLHAQMTTKTQTQTHTQTLAGCTKRGYFYSSICRSINFKCVVVSIV